MWVVTLLFFSGILYSTNGQDYQRSVPLLSPVPSYPLSLDVTESTYLAEDDNGNRKTFKLVDPNPPVVQSFSHVAPKDVEDSLSSREKRENSSDDDDYDYTKSYREFVRENFGIDDAKAFVDDTEDDGGEDNEYERIKELSQKQAEDKENSKYCKLVHKDGKDCTICKNPKTKAESETCSYSSKPKPKKYAYKRERNYNSKDDYDDDDDGKDDHEDEASQKNERRTPKNNKQNNSKKASKKAAKKTANQKSSQHEEDDHETRVKSNTAKRTKAKKQTPRQASEYYSDQALKSSEPHSSKIGSGKVDRVLEEFKKRDWSKCKKKSREGLTCYYCRDAKGGNHEECMYISDDEASASTLVDNYELPEEEIKESRRGSQPQYQTANAKRSDKIAPNPDSEGNPETHQTFKRMVSVKIHEDGDHDPSANKAVFYKKIVKIDRK